MTDWLAFAWGSRSTSKTLLSSRRVAYQAICVARVVLPTPPFMLIIDTQTAINDLLVGPRIPLGDIWNVFDYTSAWKWVSSWQGEGKKRNQKLESRQLKRGEISLCAGRRIRRSECGRKSRPAPFEMTVWF